MLTITESAFSANGKGWAAQARLIEKYLARAGM